MEQNPMYSPSGATLDSDLSRTAEETRQRLRDAGQKASRAVQRGYSSTVDYARSHPQQVNWIMFGTGICVGMLIASRMKNRSSSGYKQVARPLVDALADVGRMLTR